MINYSHWFIRARLKTRQLLLLVALAEEGNIHRASEVLDMTQPAASKLLKDLEDVLGVLLFDRLPRGMRPGHPLLAIDRLSLRDLSAWGWIVPPEGSVLRHRFDLMFREEGLDAPENLIETGALLFVTKMIAEGDMIGLLAGDVGRYY